VWFTRSSDTVKPSTRRISSLFTLSKNQSSPFPLEFRGEFLIFAQIIADVNLFVLPILQKNLGNFLKFSQRNIQENWKKFPSATETFAERSKLSRRQIRSEMEKIKLKFSGNYL
jgi:hypothetical protein